MSTFGTDFGSLLAEARSLTEGVMHNVTNLANLSALLWERLEGINWAGFYLAEEDGGLYLGPFQGKVACVHIARGRGVCGYAAERGEVTVVPDVREFPGHIACDSASRSEIVVPILVDGRVAAVMDIDSPHVGRFSAEDAAGLEAFGRIVAERWR